MLTIDSHQHFWKYDPVQHDWISDDMKVIRRDFLPEDLAPVLTTHDVQGCVAVQADQTPEETRFLLDLAREHDFIRGIVGWVELQSPQISDLLDEYSGEQKLKGFRHILQGEAVRDLMLKPRFLHGISLLEKHNYAYDILILKDQLQYIPEFVAQFPNQRFVIDHIAKPDIAKGEIDQWKKDMLKVAQHENVSVKISGMVTEADLLNWQTEDIIPYIDVVLKAFSTNRVMYGSDWPVCLASGSYTKVINLVREYFSTFSADEQQLFFGTNAKEFYHL